MKGDREGARHVVDDCEIVLVVRAVRLGGADSGLLDGPHWTVTRVARRESSAVDARLVTSRTMLPFDALADSASTGVRDVPGDVSKSLSHGWEDDRGVTVRDIRVAPPDLPMVHRGKDHEVDDVTRGRAFVGVAGRRFEGDVVDDWLEVVALIGGERDAFGGVAGSGAGHERLRCARGKPKRV